MYFILNIFIIYCLWQINVIFFCILKSYVTFVCMGGRHVSAVLITVLYYHQIITAYMLLCDCRNVKFRTQSMIVVLCKCYLLHDSTRIYCKIQKHSDIKINLAVVEFHYFRSGSLCYNSKHQLLKVSCVEVRRLLSQRSK